MVLATTSLLVTAAAPPLLPPEVSFKAPVVSRLGEAVEMPGLLCRPDRPGPARLVLLVHGSYGLVVEDKTRELPPCGSPLVWWFTRRGYSVASFLRPGYGSAPGAVDDRAFPTIGYEAASQARAHAIDAALQAALALPGVRPDGAVIVGSSTGGMGSVAFDAAPHPKAAAFISFAGGQGGHCHGRGGVICNPRDLVTAVRDLGATASTPMLWVYATNDTWFPPSLAEAMARAFAEGGGQADLHVLPAFAADGHYLASDPVGSAAWGPLVSDYLSRMGAAP